MNIEGLRIVIFSGGMGSRKIPSQKKRPLGGHVVDRLAGKRSQDNPGGHQLPQLARWSSIAAVGAAVDRRRAGWAGGAAASARAPKFELRCPGPRTKLMLTETP
jgi:hypothetical protein